MSGVKRVERNQLMMSGVQGYEGQEWLILPRSLDVSLDKV